MERKRRNGAFAREPIGGARFRGRDASDDGSVAFGIRVQRLVHFHRRNHPGYDVFADRHGCGLLLRPVGAESRVRNCGRGRDDRSADGEPLFRRNGLGRDLDCQHVQLDVLQRSGYDRFLFCFQAVLRHVEREFLNPVGGLPRSDVQRGRMNSADRDENRIFVQWLVHCGERGNANHDRYGDYRGSDVLRAMDATHLCRFRFVRSERERRHRVRLRVQRDRGDRRIVLPHGNPIWHRVQQRCRDENELFLRHFDELTREPHGGRFQRRGKLYGQYANAYLCRKARDGNRLEYRLELPPDLERLRVVARGFDDGVRCDGEHYRMPVQVLLRIRVGFGNLFVQGLG